MTTATRPLYRPFDAVVCAVNRLSPSFMRVTFGGDDLEDFWPEGLDQRVKVLLPNPSGEFPDLSSDGDSWYSAWRALPERVRPPMRTYTVRAARRHGGALELDIDFVVHGQPTPSVPDHDGDSVGDARPELPGPVSQWLAIVETGQPVKIVGADAVSAGPWASTAWDPPVGSRRYLLLGDETAAPAIAVILESLPAGCSARAFIEVPQADDELTVALPAGVELTWLARNGRAHGSVLSEAARAAVPESTTPGSTSATEGVYAWIAGESSVIKSLRRHLAQHAGMQRDHVTFMGYWRVGAAEN